VVSAGFTLATQEPVDDGRITLWEESVEKPGPNSPQWWKKPARLSGLVYYKENFRSDFPASFSYVWYEPGEGMIYLHTSAWQ
jgi:hypothetical protein